MSKLPIDLNEVKEKLKPLFALVAQMYGRSPGSALRIYKEKLDKLSQDIGFSKPDPKSSLNINPKFGIFDQAKLQLPSADNNPKDSETDLHSSTPKPRQ